MYFHHFPFHNSQMNNSIFGISINSWGVIATFILCALALFGDQLKRILFKPKIKPADEPKKTLQKGNKIYIYQRLIVKNIGSVSAKEVRVLLTYLNGPKAENFIPFPLNWTHWNKTIRDISRNEPVYIDVMFKAMGEKTYKFCYSQEVGTPWESDLTDFDPSKGHLRLEFYERNNKIGDIITSYSEEQDKLVIIKC